MSYLIYVLSCLCCGFVCDGNHKVLVENWTKELKDHSQASSSLKYLSWWDDVSFSCPSLSTCPFFLEKKTTTQKQNIKCKVWPFLKKSSDHVEILVSFTFFVSRNTHLCVSAKSKPWRQFFKKQQQQNQKN